jgi:rhodanese-related sulfurtransferase
MPQTITLGAKALVEAAKRAIRECTAAEAIELARRPDTVLVDVRDPRELEREGRVPGALHCPRGMLEFWIDPESPYFKPVFGEDKTFLFFCDSGMARHSPPRPRRTWDSNPSPTSAAASTRGGRRAVPSRGSRRNPEP